MNNSRNLRRLLLIGTILVLTSVVAVGVYTQASKSQKPKKDYGRVYDAAKVTDVPAVVSNIKGLEIAGVSLVDQGKPYAAVAINIINHRDEDVMAIDLVAGKLTTSGFLMDGLLEEDKPSVIIRRHSLRTFTWNLASIMAGETIYVAAAIFADGKEEGNKHYLEGIKRSRLDYQKRRREEKARNGGQQ